MNMIEPDLAKKADQTAAGNAHGAHHAPEGPPPAPPSKWILVTVLLVAGGVLAFGAYGHWQANAAATETQKEEVDFVPAVRSTTTKLLDAPIETTLPGQTDAFDRANVFARATG